MGDRTVSPKGQVSGARAQVSFWSIWNMCFGFLGLQFGWALQNANVSRIFQTLGADVGTIPILWVAAPLTGLIVQPLVGYLSDRTWCRLGRRRPYFLVGAILASAALIAMPRSPGLWFAAGLLWLLDGSINVSMQPFRAFIGDLLPPSQRASGYAVQSFFIGVGSVVASALPWLLSHYGVSNVAADGTIPASVRIAFDLGAVVLLVAVLWTVLSCREYPPDAVEAFSDDAPPLPVRPANPRRGLVWGLGWAVIGAALIIAIYRLRLDPQLYLLSVGLFLWGVLLLTHRHGRGPLSTILVKLQTMPQMMVELAPVQFFSWVGFFALWIYATPAVAQRFYGAIDPHAAAYNEGANWVGILFAAYNGFAALGAVIIPLLVRHMGIGKSHILNLWLGAAGFVAFLLIRDPVWLVAAMVGVGFAWASVLSLPYALLSDHVPAAQMGLYMGVFNLFVVIPQLVAASVLGFLLKSFFGGAPIFAFALGGGSFLIAGLLMLRVRQ